VVFFLILFPRDAISFPRNSISFPRNAMSRERDSYFRGNELLFRGNEIITSWERNNKIVLSIPPMSMPARDRTDMGSDLFIISFGRNSISRERNN